MSPDGAGGPGTRGDPYRDIEALVRATHAELGGVAFRTLGNQADAEDAVQSACIKAFRCWPKLASFQTAGQQRAYLFTTVANEALQILRRPHRQREIFAVEEGDSSWIPDFPGGHGQAPREQLKRVWQAISELPDENRHVMALFAVGYEYREIAEMMDITESTVRSHVSSARRRLPRMPDDSGGEGLA